MTSLVQSVEDVYNLLFNSDMRKFFDSLTGVDALMDFARWRREQSRKENIPMRLKLTDAINPPIVFIVNTIDPDYAKIASALRDQTVVFTYGKSPFYNESVWFNKGIKEALYMGAKWVVLMSDDLYEVTPIQKLMEALSKINNEAMDTVWIDPWPDFYHSYPAYLAKRHPLENVLGRDHLKLAKLYDKFGVETVVASETPIRKPFHFWLFNRAFPRPYVGPSFTMTSDFAILSVEWCRKQGPEVLSELFCGWQDCDLSLRLKDARSAIVDFRIGSTIGGTFKPGLDKAMRELYNLSIFNSLLREGRYG